MEVGGGDIAKKSIHPLVGHVDAVEEVEKREPSDKVVTECWKG